MRERPIIFSAPMVRALLAGTKTQTRRLVKPQPTHFNPAGVPRLAHPERASDVIRCPYGQPGDRLWVREAWRGVVNIAPPGSYEYAVARYVPDREHCLDVEYAATQAAYGEPWRSPIFMPRWASRITLEITGIRVERLRDISDPDAHAEGCRIRDMRHGDRLASVYARLWESLNGAGSWDANPWVWCVEFKRVEGGAA